MEKDKFMQSKIMSFKKNHEKFKNQTDRINECVDKVVSVFDEDNTVIDANYAVLLSEIIDLTSVIMKKSEIDKVHQMADLGEIVSLIKERDNNGSLEIPYEEAMNEVRKHLAEIKYIQ